MADYWLTFTVSETTTGHKTAGARRDALYEAINKMTSSWWLEPTSFMLFTSSGNIDALATACRGAIAPSHDLVLIREINKQNARVIGNVDDLEMLKTFIPYVKKV